MKNMRTMGPFLLAAALIVVVLGVVIKQRYVQRARYQNPYEFDVSAYKQTDPSLLGYRETTSFAVDMTPRGLAVGGEGRLYVAGDEALVILDGAGQELKRVALETPATCIKAGPRGALLLLGMGDHVDIRDTEGAWRGTWKPISDRSVITSIAASDEIVYVADAGTRQVRVYNWEGDMLGTVGDKDEALGIPGFVIPSPYFDLLIGETNTVWVANPGRRQLEQYDPDGNLLKTWGASSMEWSGFSGCCNPTHIARLPDGAFVTSEKGLPRVKVYESDGAFRNVVAGPESFAEDVLGLDLAVDSAGRVLVLDPAAKAVRVFEVSQAKPAEG